MSIAIFHSTRTGQSESRASAYLFSDTVAKQAMQAREMASSTKTMIVLTVIAAVMAAVLSSVQAKSSEDVPDVQFFCNKLNFTRGSSGARNTQDILSRLQSKAKAAAIGKPVRDRLRNPDVFGIAQCDRSVSREECSSCLEVAADSIKNKCSNTVGARFLVRKTCRIQYEPEEIKN